MITDVSTLFTSLFLCYILTHTHKHIHTYQVITQSAVHLISSLKTPWCISYWHRFLQVKAASLVWREFCPFQYYNHLSFDSFDCCSEKSHNHTDTGKLVPQQHLLLKTLTCGGQKSPSPFTPMNFFLPYWRECPMSPPKEQSQVLGCRYHITKTTLIFPSLWPPDIFNTLPKAISASLLHLPIGH